MKNRLTFLLALVMIFSLVPAQIYATSGNSINKTPAVNQEYIFSSTSAVAPSILAIREGNDDEFGTTTQTFQLKLHNAGLLPNAEDDMATYAMANNTDATVDITRLSDYKLEVNLSFDAGTDAAEKIQLPIYVQVGVTGEAKIEVVSRDSSVSSGTYTFARVSGGTSTTIEGLTTLNDEEDIAIEDIFIEENVVGVLQNVSEIRLKITDNDFEWEDSANVTIAGYGGFNFSYNPVAEDFDDNVLTFEIADLDIVGAADPVTRGTIKISGLEINSNLEDECRDVNVRIYGDHVTTETIAVGECKSLGYSVTVAKDPDDDMATLFAGEIGDASVFSTENELATLYIGDNVTGAWLVGRTTTIEFPEWVKIMEFQFLANNLQDEDGDAITYDDFDFTVGDNEIKLKNWENDGTGRAELGIKFFISIKANSTGDIEATVSGSALDEDYKVKLGEAITPVTVSADKNDVSLGFKDQEVSTITISENVAEALADSSTIQMLLEDGVEWSTAPIVKVTKGDLTIAHAERNGNVISIIIDDESTEKSTIEISGLKVDVDRIAPEGVFYLIVGGDALVMNYDPDGNGYDFDQGYMSIKPFVNVMRPAQQEAQETDEVSFIIGSKEYKVGSEVVAMDAVPFIDDNNRTMLPLRAFANGLGISDNNILWNSTEQSVTLFKGNRVIKIVPGESYFTVNGVTIPMDTNAKITNNRTYLPVRALGQALGADVHWDAAAMRVAINKLRKRN